jgi:hypothetical protein
LPRPKVAATDLSSRGDTSDRSRDDTGDQDEKSGAMDPRESARSYDIGPSTLTVSHIREVEALGYFVKALHVSRGRKSFWNQQPTKLSCLRNFLL